MRQETVPEVVPGGWHPAVPIPPIRGASTMGVVEISRGCGLGCSFCTIARVPMVHLPPETMLADVRTNVAAGAGERRRIERGFLSLRRGRHEGRSRRADRAASGHPPDSAGPLDPGRSRKRGQRRAIRRPATGDPSRSAGGPRQPPLRLGERGRGNGLRGAAPQRGCGGEKGRARSRNPGAISAPATCGGCAVPSSFPWPVS